MKGSLRSSQVNPGHNTFFEALSCPRFRAGLAKGKTPQVDKAQATHDATGCSPAHRLPSINTRPSVTTVFSPSWTPSSASPITPESKGNQRPPPARQSRPPNEPELQSPPHFGSFSRLPRGNRPSVVWPALVPWRRAAPLSGRAHVLVAWLWGTTRLEGLEGRWRGTRGRCCDANSGLMLALQDAFCTERYVHVQVLYCF